MGVAYSFPYENLQGRVTAQSAPQREINTRIINLYSLASPAHCALAIRLQSSCESYACVTEGDL